MGLFHKLFSSILIAAILLSIEAQTSTCTIGNPQAATTYKCPRSYHCCDNGLCCPNWLQTWWVWCFMLVMVILLACGSFLIVRRYRRHISTPPVMVTHPNNSFSLSTPVQIPYPLSCASMAAPPNYYGYTYPGLPISTKPYFPSAPPFENR
eukprot:Sdes_comp10203_c0_seq1m1819